MANITVSALLTEADAAQKVKSFLEQVKQGTAALTRGQKTY